MKPQKPIRVIPHKGKHKTEIRVYAQERWESFCAQPGCKFKGKRAAQGICFSNLKGPDLAYLERTSKYAEECLADLRRTSRKYKESQKSYIKILEAWHLCHVMNMESTIQDLVRLRIENAKLKLKAGKWK